MSSSQPASPVLPARPRDDAWFAEEVQPHEPSLRKFLRARFPTLADLDDLIQESYVRLFRARATGKVRNARAYLYSTARNAALDRFRHERIVPLVPLQETFRSDDHDIPAAVQLDQELTLLKEAVARLPDRCRRVFVLRKMYELSHAEISRDLGIAESTIEGHVNDGIRKVAAYLKRHGLP